MPRVRAPRNFTLPREMAISRPFIYRLYPVFQSAAVVATVLFALVYTLRLAGFVSITQGFDTRTQVASPAMEADAGEVQAFEPAVEESMVEEPVSGFDELEAEKSIPAADAPLEEDFLPSAEMEIPAPDPGSRATAPTTALGEAEEGEAVAPLAMEAMEEPTLTPTPTPTPVPTPEPTATPLPTPEPIQTPSFAEVFQQNPVAIPAWAIWVLGGVALSAIAFTLLLRFRQP